MVGIDKKVEANVEDKLKQQHSSQSNRPYLLLYQEWQPQPPSSEQSQKPRESSSVRSPSFIPFHFDSKTKTSKLRGKQSGTLINSINHHSTKMPSKFAVLASSDHDDDSGDEDNNINVSKSKSTSSKSKKQSKKSHPTSNIIPTPPKPPLNVVSSTKTTSRASNSGPMPKPLKPPLSSTTTNRKALLSKSKDKSIKPSKKSLQSSSPPSSSNEHRKFLNDSSSSEEFIDKRKISIKKAIITASPLQSLFIWSISAIYLFAFISFYYQIRGLYGDHGVLPLSHFAAQLGTTRNRSGTSGLSPDELYQVAPSLVWLFARAGNFTLTSTLELLALSGVIVSFLQLLFASFRSFFNYVFLFVLYLSLTQVGQIFFFFQWDSLLLEIGTLTILVACSVNDLGVYFAPDHRLTLWPIRWLLYKFMFSSGVVKLTSRCPIWWSLRTLDIHFESQCLPTPLAWYAHQLPTNWVHLATALTFVLEIGGPFLFFVPLRSVKWFSFVTQVLFQIAIIITGNYNFFNLLTIVMCLSLLDDEMLFGDNNCEEKNKNQKKEVRSSWLNIETIFNGILIGAIAYILVHYFDVHFATDDDPRITSLWSALMIGPVSRVKFTLDGFNLFLSYAITASIWIGITSWVVVSLRALLKSISSFTNRSSIFGKSVNFIITLVFVILTGAVLAVSIVPLAELDTSGAYLRRLPTPLKRWHQTAEENRFVASYGLFRTMTGADGRPELVIEGTNNPNDESWKAYHFVYKPTDLWQAPKFNIPHQPRLDWQMWFAALGQYQQNSWLLSLCHRILSGEPDVLNLLDTTRLPFPLDQPPKYIRISRYPYRFTSGEITQSSLAWWQRTSNRYAYLPVVNKETLANVLQLDKLSIPRWIQQLNEQERAKHSVIRAILDRLYQTLVYRWSHYQLGRPNVVMILLVLIAIVWQVVTRGRCGTFNNKSGK